MKKILLFIIPLVFATQGIAQPKPGDFMLGGNLAFGRQRGLVPDNAATGVSTQSRLSFAPSVGVFFSKRIAVGFSTNINYEGSASSVVRKDSNGVSFQEKSQYYELELGFGLVGSYFYPINDKLFWVSSLNVNWGSFIHGDRVSSLFGEDKPKQDREKFVNMQLTTGVQYFLKPTISLAVGYKPASLTYNYQRLLRENVALAKKDMVTFEYSSIARGLFISLNFLIISDGTKNE